MTKPIFEIKDIQGADGIRFRSVNFEIPGGVTTPAQFAEAVQEIQAQLVGALPILINGRGPVWGYGMLLHSAHPSPAIATYIPVPVMSSFKLTMNDFNSEPRSICHESS